MRKRPPRGPFSFISEKWVRQSVFLQGLASVRPVQSRVTSHPAPCGVWVGVVVLSVVRQRGWTASEAVGGVAVVAAAAGSFGVFVGLTTGGGGVRLSLGGDIGVFVNPIS